MFIQALLESLLLLVGVIGEEVLLSSDGDFVTAGAGCEQLRRAESC